MTKLKVTVWAVVRETADGSEFVPAQSVALTRNRAKALAEEIDKRNPEYGQVNPVVRVARFRLIECSEDSNNQDNADSSDHISGNE